MRIMSSGTSVKWIDPVTFHDFGVLAPIPQIGTGIIIATKVLEYSTGLSFAKFALNDTRHFERYQSVDVTNNSPEPVTYTFYIEAAGGSNCLYDSYVDKVPGGKPLPGIWPQEMLPVVSKWPSGTFTLKLGQTRTARYILSASICDA